MKIAGGLKENGIEVGNTYDKYKARNPVARLLMSGAVFSAWKNPLSLK